MKQAEASYYHTTPNNTLQCTLCPNHCILEKGKYGRCKVRKNIDNKLYTDVYGVISAANFDPIEKKPLYHFFPGKNILSIGTVGCNLRCEFCQNHEISQHALSEVTHQQEFLPEDIVKAAMQRTDNIGVAYTYNEPSIWIEYMLDIAKLVKINRLKNVMVSNGYISPAALDEILKYMDAFNIDLKGFTSDFYKTYTHSGIEPVKENLKKIRKSGKHLEITNLVIPELNDDPVVFTEMVRWIASELGRKTIFHLSRYFPCYHLKIGTTPASTMENLYKIAKQHLDFVYVGNITIKGTNDTVCPICAKTVIRRFGYIVQKFGINKSGNCIFCEEKILFDNV